MRVSVDAVPSELLRQACAGYLCIKSLAICWPGYCSGSRRCWIDAPCKTRFGVPSAAAAERTLPGQQQQLWQSRGHCNVCLLLIGCFQCPFWLRWELRDGQCIVNAFLDQAHHCGSGTRAAIECFIWSCLLLCICIQMWLRLDYNRCYIRLSVGKQQSGGAYCCRT